MIDRRTFLTWLGGSALALSFPGATLAQSAAAASVDQAVNKAGRARMLTQRCAKAWLMQALGVMPEKATRWQSESIAQFEAQLAALEDLGSTSALGLLVRINADWDAFKAALALTPNRDGAAELFHRADAVLTSADMATRAYEKLSGSRLGWLINQSARQSMLSQRAADFVFFSSLGVEKSASVEGLQRVREEFAYGIAELKSAPENTRRIASELALAEQQWFLFEGALADSSSPRALRDIATTSELMLQQLTVLDDLYAEIPVSKGATMADG